MKKTNLLSSVAFCFMLAIAPAYATNSFDDVPEEDVARAVIKILKTNPKIVYDSLEQFYKDRDARKAEYTEDNFSPLEKKIAAVLKENPQILVGALQIYDQEQHQKELLKTAENYQKYAKEINQAGIFAGNPDGKYTLVEFFDFSCGYCKQMAPRLKKIIEKNSDVKVVFKPVSFLSPMSEVAAKAAVAAHKQGKFLEMYIRLMAATNLSETDIEKIAKEVGLDMEQYKKDVASKETKNLLASFKDTADKIEMKSVPTLVLNGMPLYAVEEVQIQHAIDVLRKSK